MNPIPELHTGEQLLGHRQGFKPNALMRSDYLGRGGGKAKAVELVSLLEARGGRTTIELCRELEIPHRKLGAVVDIARKFEHAHENGDIRAIRDESNGRLWYYWLIYDPTGLIGRALDNIQRSLGLIGSARKIMDVVSAYSLDGDQAKAAELIGQLTRGFEGAASAVLDRVRPLLPGAVEEARLNARPPTHAELGVQKEGGPIVDDEPDDIWEVARRRAAG